MAQLKTQKPKRSVTEFLAQVDDERRSDCRALVRLMGEATAAKPTMWGPSIIGFGRYRYKNGSGKSTDWFIAGFSPRKRDLTLYLMAGVSRFPQLLARLGQHSTGVSCLYIKRLADVDAAVLKELLDASVRWTREHAEPASAATP